MVTISLRRDRLCHTMITIRLRPITEFHCLQHIVIIMELKWGAAERKPDTIKHSEYNAAIILVFW